MIVAAGIKKRIEKAGSGLTLTRLKKTDNALTN